MQAADHTRLRVAFLGMLVVSLMSALVMRLWFLQVLAQRTYREAAVQNQVRIVPIQPARGRILDRNGEVLLKNRPSLVILVRPDEVRDREQTLGRLAGLLGVSVQQVEERLADKRALPYSAIPIAEDVSEDLVVYILEHRDEFPGVSAETRPVRIYPKGALAAHAIGYVGQITSEQLKQERYSGYRPGSVVGRAGLEYAYEHDLHGEEGLVKLQVDASGKSKGELPGQRREPVPGLDLQLTLDATVQTLVEESLAQGILKARTIYDKESAKRYLAPSGGAVVLDPRNGEILAMASYPTYDPGLFVGGISQAGFRQLQDDPAKPLIDRVTQAAFPPGSTFKTVTAAAALQEGLASRNSRFACPPSVRLYDQNFRNWRTVDGGMISLAQALVESCDTVFYGFGAEFWRRFRGGQGERLQDYARQFGFGSRTGVELPFEGAGRVPDEGWLKEVHARFPQAFPYKIWLPGYTINMSIGQGDLTTTPIQLASSYAAIANGGTLFRPHLGLKVADGDRVVRTIEARELGKLPVSPANLDIIRQGLDGVVVNGTAKGPFTGFPFQAVTVAAKTGTAELQTVPPKQPYAWFVAYAPAQNPQYVVAVMLEEAGHGGETAAPVARRIIEGLFGLPLSEITPSARTD
ncbi:MAG: penicillin-binding protein 2 [Actinomycetota bacterium]